MTYKAREVLLDCRIALKMLEEEADFQKWRISWAAAVALIRAVGHVLEKVDGTNPKIKNISNTLHKEWKGNLEEHQIYREFIEQERNNLLKEYHMNVHPLVTVPVTLVLSAVSPEGKDNFTMGDTFEIGDNIYRPMMDGPWEGDDARDVLQEAINWWEKQLDKIDTLSKGTKKRD